MDLYAILSSLMKYIFVTAIYVFIFAIIRMIYKDIRGMVDSEEYAVNQAAAILRMVPNLDGEAEVATNDFALDKTMNIIGRGKTADIQISDMMVSKKHFSIWHEDGEWRIKDLGSSNGTYLNEERIDEQYLLDDGDVIRVGEIEMEFKF